jgi:hypothetical protein
MSKNALVSATVLYEGAHSVGKSLAIKQLLGDSKFQHTVIDRGFASNYAFALLYGRRPLDLGRAIHDYFANPTACLVHLKLGADSYQQEYLAARSAGAYADPVQGCVDNAKLDELIAVAVGSAVSYGYGSRVLTLPARANALTSDRQRNLILNFVSKIANTF